MVSLESDLMIMSRENRKDRNRRKIREELTERKTHYSRRDQETLELEMTFNQKEI